MSVASRSTIGGLFGGLGSLATKAGGLFGGRRRAVASLAAAVDAQTSHAAHASSARESTPGVSDTHALIEQMLAQGRFALLLREQIIGHLTRDQLERAVVALDEQMSLVPDGDVLVGGWRSEADGPRDQLTPADRIVPVEALYLDRYPVTNRQYQQFVAAGGYEQMALWDAEIWPGILQFVDRSGAAGPRSWSDGTLPRGQEEHPVVGISWYEAAAYARWVGKRLPTDAEWIKAGAWPVASAGARPRQRRYPWGDTMDRACANLWGSRAAGIVPVGEYAAGVSVGGVYQLIGNVWEWTYSDFAPWEVAAGRLQVEGPMKSVRGGAFDTYFDHQCTCQFQSGDSPLARKHNIGFRCAIGACDLASVADNINSGDGNRVPAGGEACVAEVSV